MGWLPWRRECADRVDGQHFAAVWDRALPVWSHVDYQRCVRLFFRRAAPPSMMTITVINERCRRPVTSLKSGARGSSAQRRPRAIRPAPPPPPEVCVWVRGEGQSACARICSQTQVHTPQPASRLEMGKNRKFWVRVLFGSARVLRRWNWGDVSVLVICYGLTVIVGLSTS